LLDWPIGMPSSRRAATEEILHPLALYEERYAGFTVKHFPEQMTKRHNHKHGYIKTPRALPGCPARLVNTT
jgi:hypothetical protein